MSTLVYNTIKASVVGKMKGTKYVIYVITIAMLLLNLTLITSAIQITQESKANGYIVVDKGKNGDYTSIQQAIDNAESGSKIYVKKGEYTEVVFVDKSIRLFGEDKKSTLINPISEKNKYAICLGAHNIKIENFTVINRAPGLYSTAIKVTRSNTEINNCLIQNTPVGIAIWTSENIVKNCDFRECEDEGIAFLGWKNSDCKNNKVLNCTFTENCDGIELQYSSDNIIRDCNFYRNSHTGIDAIASSNNNNKIIGCIIKNNRVNGIYFSSSSDNEIIDCDVSDNIDGNIVTNKYSKNNQIIYTNQDETEDENKESVRDIIQIILQKFEKLKSSRLQQILSSINF